MNLRHPLFAAALLCASAATADDWPAFRGPNRDGVCKETGLLQSWPKDGPPKAWTVKNRGEGFGTPSVADGKIFGLGARDGKEVVWALKESDGSELWATPIDTPRKNDRNNGPSSTPTFDQGKLYAVSTNGKLVKLDAATGQAEWTKDYADYGGKAQGWGYTNSPLVDGDQVVCTPVSNKAALVALDKKTGKELWKTEVPGGVGGGAGYSSPVKVTLAGAPMYLLLTGDKGGLIAADPGTGKLLWQYTGKAATGRTAQIPIPVVYKNHVWVSCSYDGGAALLDVSGTGGKFTVKELKTYAKPELNNHHGGMVQVGEYVFFGHNQNNGNPVCVDMNTGEIKWGPDKPPAGGSGSAAVLSADGRLYFRYENHVLALIEPSPEGLKLVSLFKLPEPSAKQSWPHPVVANGKLYIRDQDKLHCFNVKADKN